MIDNYFSQEKKIQITSNIMIILIYLISFLSIVSKKGVIKNNLKFKIDSIENILLIFFFSNLMVIFLNNIVYRYLTSKFNSFKPFLYIFFKISKFAKNSILHLFYILYSIKIIFEIKNISIDEIGNEDNILLKINIISCFNMFYYFNLIYTNLIIWMNYRDNKIISFVFIFLMLIPNFINLISFNFYLNEIVQISFLVISTFLMIYIRDRIFSRILEENKFVTSRPVIEESAIKNEDNNNDKIISENQFNLVNFNNFSNFYYFYFSKNKINGINENFKYFLKENKEKILYDYDKNDKFIIDENYNNLKSENPKIDCNNNLNHDLPLNIEFNNSKKNNEKYEIKINCKNIDRETHSKTFKNLINKIKLFKNTNKNYLKEINEFFDNFFQKNKTKNIQIENSLRKINTFNCLKKNPVQNIGIEIIEFDNSLNEDFDYKIEDLIAINKGESLFKLIDNISKVLKHFNFDNKENFDFKNEKNFLNKRHESFIRKSNTSIKKVILKTKKDLDNSSFQNFIPDKVNLTNNMILKIDEKKPVQEELKTYKKYKDIKLNLEKSILFENKNYENNPKLNFSKNDEIFKKKYSIRRNSFRDKSQIINIGIFTLQLTTIKKNEKNKKDNHIVSVDKIYYNDFNTLYYEISIILNVICHKKKEYKIEFIIKDVSKYFKSYEKLKNISNSNYLNISKLIHEFKTPLNCIIGLADETQLLLAPKINLIQNYELLKDDIERINGLSNYTVFLIKDLTDYLLKFNENKKLNEYNIVDEDGFFEENKNNRTYKDLNNNSDKKISINFRKTDEKYLKKGISQKSKKQKSLQKNIINLDYYSLIDILDFSYSILTSLIKCSKLKSKNIHPNLLISEDVKNFMIYIDEIKLKQILLNLISNSVKFTNSGYIEIEAKYMNDFSKKFVEINIKDTGIGINNDEQHKIFKDYSNIQHDKSQKNNNVWGTGLGLSLSRNIASLLDIDLTYDFTYTNGSKFNIIIPIEKFKNNYNSASINVQNVNKIYNITNKIYFNQENHTSNISNENSNRLTNKDINNNSSVIDSFTKQETKVFMSGIRIIDRNNLNLRKSNLDRYSTGRISKKNSSKEKIFYYNSYDIDQNQNFTDDNINISTLLDRIMKREQISKNLEYKKSLLTVDYNYDKTNIQNNSGVLEKEEEIIKNNKIIPLYEESFSDKKIILNNSHCLDSSTPRTKLSNMTSYLRINPSIRNKVCDFL